MKVLVVHEVSYLKKVVYEYQDFAERLASRGHQVLVIDYDDAGDGRYQKARVSKTGVGEVTLENTPCLNLPIFKYLTGRLNYRKLLEEKLKNREIDVVFLYSVFINGTNTIRLCKKYGVPVVYRVLDVYHKLRENPLISIPLYFGERFIYRNADLISLTNEKMGYYVESVAKEGRLAPTSVLQHGVDTDFFKPMPRDPAFASQYGIKPSDRIALFLGTTYSFSGLDVVVENFEKLRSQVPEIKVIIVGGGDLDAKLKTLVESKGLSDRIILTGMRPYSEVARWISLADVTFNSFYINAITESIVPIKLLQYLASGKPVVSAPIPDVMRIFPDAESGMVYAPIENPTAFMERIVRVLSNPTEHALLTKNALSIIKKNHSMDATVERLESQLKRAIDSKQV